MTTEPPWAIATCWEIARPNPDPLPPPRSNRSSTRCRSGGATPGPLSSTITVLPTIDTTTCCAEPSLGTPCTNALRTRLAMANRTPSRQATKVVGGTDSISIVASGARRRSSATAASATSARSISSNHDRSANSASARARTADNDAAIRCNCSLARPSTSARSASAIRSLRAMSKLITAPCSGVRNSWVAEAANARAASSAAPRRFVSSARRSRFSFNVAATSSTSVEP